MARLAQLAALTALLAACGLLIGACSGDEGDGTETAAESVQEEAGGAGAGATGSAGGAGGNSSGNGAGEGADRNGSGGSGTDQPPDDLTAQATPTDPAEIARRIPQAQVTEEGRVQTLAPDAERRETAQKNTYGSIRGFGDETAERESTEITYAVAQYLDAIARGNWQLACERLYSPLRENLEGDRDCPAALGAMMRRVPAKTRAQAGRIDVSSVRMGEDGDETRAFVIYKYPGVRSADMPLYLEDGTWKVAALEAYVLRPENVG